jgi:hypothetical protein
MVKEIYRTPKGRSIHDVVRARHFESFDEKEKVKITQLNKEYGIPKRHLAKRFRTSDETIIKETGEQISK